MTRRTVVTRRAAVVLAAFMLLGSFASSAMSQELPRHPHMLVLGLQLDADEEPIGYRSCVDLAGNKAVPLNAHHANLHTGKAGEAQWEAGNVVVPGAPLTPWANCAELVAEIFGD